MTGRQRKSAWISANWPDVVGIPRPGDGPWMLRDTPLTLSDLCNLRTRDLVEKEDEFPVHVMGTDTKPEAVQMRYRTKKQDGPFDWIETRSDLPRTTAEAFAARPDADLYVVDVVVDHVPRVPPAGVGIDRIEDELGLDVQTVTVTAVDADPDTSEYPGRVVSVDRDDLTNTASAVARAIPAADIMSVTVGPERAASAANLIAETGPEFRLINSDPGVFVDRAEEFLVSDDTVDVALPQWQRPDDSQQRLLSHFAPGVVVDDVDLDPVGESGQTSLESLETTSEA